MVIIFADDFEEKYLNTAAVRYAFDKKSLSIGNLSYCPWISTFYNEMKNDLLFSTDGNVGPSAGLFDMICLIDNTSHRVKHIQRKAGAAITTRLPGRWFQLAEPVDIIKKRVV
jgi:hypothetical protein